MILASKCIILNGMDPPEIVFYYLELNAEYMSFLQFYAYTIARIFDLMYSFLGLVARVYRTNHVLVPCLQHM